MAISLFLNSFLFPPSFPVIYSKRQAGFPLRLITAKNLFYDFFFTCFKNQPLFATFSYFLPLSFSLLQTAPSPFSVTFLMLHLLTYKRTLLALQFVVSPKISQKFFLLKVFSLICAYKSIELGATSQTVTPFCLDKQTINKEPGKQYSPCKFRILLFAELLTVLCRVQLPNKR